MGYNIFNSKGECTSYYAYLGDWSFDKFYKACQTTRPLPIKGVYPNKNASEEERFVIYLKTAFRDYLADAYANYDCRYVSLRELFSRFASDYLFSDWYKDTFNQRPHLDADFYLYAMGYHDVRDSVAWTFCDSHEFSEDVEEAVKSAEAYRTYLLERD